MAKGGYPMRVVTAIAVGAALGVAGWLLMSLFVMLLVGSLHIWWHFIPSMGWDSATKIGIILYAFSIGPAVGIYKTR
jgi:hypothetical protein